MITPFRERELTAYRFRHALKYLELVLIIQESTGNVNPKFDTKNDFHHQQKPRRTGTIPKLRGFSNNSIGAERGI